MDMAVTQSCKFLQLPCNNFTVGGHTTQLLIHLVINSSYGQGLCRFRTRD